jgi:hypothetical protein
MTTTETRDRFVAAIAERVDTDAVVEVHLFQPLKQGIIESGVAVVAVDEHLATAENRPESRSDSAENDSEASGRAAGAQAGNRLAVYTASYRLTLKGPDRGKWDFTLQADADAPLVTVDKVVQGVQRRSGDAEEAQKLSGEEFRALLPQREATPGTAGERTA